jgi:hypothetical protein
MENSFQPELWRDLFVMLGTSAAALIGLLFVAASVRISEATDRPVFRIRSRSITMHLLAMLVQAMAVLTPQPMKFLGAEVVIINLCGLWLPLSFLYKMIRKHRSEQRREGVTAYRATSVIVGYLLGVVGGVALINSASWGMYLMPVSYAVILVFITLTAWLIMFGVEQKEATTKPN